MGREGNVLLADDGEFFDQVRENLAVAFGRGVADGVGEIDRRGAGLDGGLGDLFQEIELGAAGIFGREFDVAGVGQGLLNRLDADADDFFLALAELEIAVDFGGGAEDVNAGALGALDGFAGAFDVFGRTAGQAAADGGFQFSSNRLNGFEVAGGGDGEAGLDDVHAESFELMGDFQLFLEIEGGARGLLAISQCGVEDPYVFHDRLLCPAEPDLRDLSGTAGRTNKKPRDLDRRVESYM